MTLTIDLSPEQEADLKQQASAAGLTAEDFARQALGQALAGDRDVEDRPVSELIRDIVGEIPSEELAKIPRDGSSQVDHYVSGLDTR